MATSNYEDQHIMLSQASSTSPREEKSIDILAAAPPSPQIVLKSPTTQSSNKDIYSVEIQSGTHMKVFMPPHIQQEMAAIHQKQQPSKRPRIQNQPKNEEKTKVIIGFDSNASSIAAQNESSSPQEDTNVEIPESVRHYERQLRKMQAATRASTELSSDQLQIVYNDSHIVVVNKPSGFLTVPGVHNNPNLLSLVYETLPQRDPDEAKILNQLEKMEHMIVHRLDMDTSGLVMFAKTKESMAQLQASFRQGTMDQTQSKNNRNKKRWKNRKRQKESEQKNGNNNNDNPLPVSKPIQKEYEAILCGHLTPASLESIEIDLPLQRDHQHPPFMRVATPTSEQEAQEVVKGLNHAGWKKIVKKQAKPSQTLVQVLQREYVVVQRVTTGQTNNDSNDDDGTNNNKNNMIGTEALTVGMKLPVTRVRLIPVTGRTHQLRVHCAAIGHPILADPTYGILGEASPNGGFDTTSLLVDQSIGNTDGRATASTKLQLQLDQWAKDHKQVMCLHARKLQLNHPITGEELCLEEAPTF